MNTPIDQARRIIAMCPSRPLATRVAVRDHCILGVGPVEELSCRPSARAARLAACTA